MRGGKGRIRVYSVLGGMVLSLGLISAGYATSGIKEVESVPGPTRSGGAAALGLGDRTGSPVGGGASCSPCHSGGSFTPSLTIEVKDALNNVVTSYTPGDTYTIEYTVNAASGSPAGYGFQSLAISPTGGNPGAGTYGAINSPNSQITPSGGRDYFEHQGIQSAGFFSVDWTAPAAGFGQVDIYAIAVAVNGNGGTSGDQVTPGTTISLTEDVPTSIDFPGNPYCANESNPTPVVTGEQGGSFSAPAGLDLNSGSGQINLAGSTPGTYTVTYAGATQSATFDVTIHPTFTVSDAVTICSNETYQFGTQTLTSANAGLNTEVFQSINGCDSTVNLTLTIIQDITTSLSETICDNETFNFNGQSLDSSNAGLNTFVTTAASGCDSTVELTLTILPTETVQISETICPSETYDFNGQILDSSDVGLNTVTLTNVNGCDSVVDLTLNLTTIDTSVTQNGGLFTANQANAAYQWVDCDSNFAPIPGETGQSYTASMTITVAVEVTVGNCTETSSCYEIIFFGLDENSTSLLQVYPSPAKDVLFVKNISALSDVKSMEIVSVSGKQMSTLNGAQDQIDVANLPAGAYFLKVKHSNGEEVVRFMKQ